MRYNAPVQRHVGRQFHNVFGNSADAMAGLLALHFPVGKIIDVNYGLGVFYKNTTRDVIGVDLRETGDVICDNKALPFADDTTDGTPKAPS